MRIHRLLSLLVMTVIPLSLNAVKSADAAMLVVDANSYWFNGPNGGRFPPGWPNYADIVSLGFPPVEVSESITGHSHSQYYGSNLGDLAYYAYVHATAVGDNMIASAWSEGTRFEVTGRPVNSLFPSGTHVPLPARFDLAIMGRDRGVGAHVHQEFRNFVNVAWEITVAPGDYVEAWTSTNFWPTYSPYAYPHLSSSQITYSTPGTYIFTYQGDYTYLAQYLSLEIRHQSSFRILRGVGDEWGDTPSSVRLLYGGVATTSDLSIGPNYFTPVNIVPEPSTLVAVLSLFPFGMGMLVVRGRAGLHLNDGA